MLQCTSTLVPKIALPRYIDVSCRLSGPSPNTVIEFRYLLCFSHLSSSLVIYLYSSHPSQFIEIAFSSFPFVCHVDVLVLNSVSLTRAPLCRLLLGEIIAGVVPSHVLLFKLPADTIPISEQL